MLFESIRLPLHILPIQFLLLQDDRTAIATAFFGLAVWPHERIDTRHE
jgi:hypothetical protein